MKNISLLFSLVITLLLVGCSEDKSESSITLNETEDILSIEEPMSDDVKNIEGNSIESVPEKSTEIIEEVKPNVQQGSIEQHITDEVTKENAKEILAKVDNKIDYYEFYTENAVDKGEQTLDELENVDSIVYEQTSEGLIHLPLKQDNEKIFTNQSEFVTLSELEAIKAVTYVEDPLTQSQLLDVNLDILREHYFGKSYSFGFEEIEYAMYIDEEAPNFGFIVIQDATITLEELKEKGKINILN